MLKRIIEAYRKDPHRWNGEVIAWVLTIAAFICAYIAVYCGITDGRIMIGFLALIIWAIGNLIKTV